MGTFSDHLTVTKVDSKNWRVEKQFYYTRSLTDFVDVPEGFITDFASVPRVFWSVLPPDGKYSQAAVVHDRLYVTHERSKPESDYIFYEAMKDSGVPKWTRELMYWCVKIFGGKSWKEMNSR